MLHTETLKRLGGVQLTWGGVYRGLGVFPGENPLHYQLHVYMHARVVFFCIAKMIILTMSQLLWHYII